jgi:hypothetical protein
MSPSVRHHQRHGPRDRAAIRSRINKTKPQASKIKGKGLQVAKFSHKKRDAFRLCPRLNRRPESRPSAHRLTSNTGQMAYARCDARPKPLATSQATAGSRCGNERPAPPARSTPPVALRSLTQQTIRLTRSSICWTDAAAPEASAGSVRAPTPSSTSVVEFDRPQAISRLMSRRRCGNVPRKYARRSRRMAADDRTAKFWFRNITSASGSHLPARRTAVQSPSGHSSPFHDCTKQERLRHGDAYSAPAHRLSGWCCSVSLENTGR